MLAEPLRDSLKLSFELLSYSQKDNRVELLFKSGKSYEADLLIGADGVHSKARNSLFPKPQSKYMGLICARGVSTEDFQKEFPASMEHVVSTGRAFVIRTLPKARAYWYFVIKHPEEGLAQIKDRKEFLLNAVSDWISPYPEVIKNTP